MSDEVPRVGVGVFILNEQNKFVMGVRKGSLGSGTLALPGGHLDFGESFEECARREVKEETDLDIINVRFLTAVNSVLEKDRKHYVTIFVVGGLSKHSKQPALMEPDKCEGWFWVEWEEMKSWATPELSEDGFQLDNINSNSKRVFESAKSKLFLPLLNLVRDRPDVVPNP